MSESDKKKNETDLPFPVTNNAHLSISTVKSEFFSYRLNVKKHCKFNVINCKFLE